VADSWSSPNPYSNSAPSTWARWCLQNH
jgi:hypothetical protein